MIWREPLNTWLTVGRIRCNFRVDESVQKQHFHRQQQSSWKKNKIFINSKQDKSCISLQSCAHYYLKTKHAIVYLYSIYLFQGIPTMFTKITPRTNRRTDRQADNRCHNHFTTLLEIVQSNECSMILFLIF